MYDFVFAGAIVFIASVLQAAVGFGFAIVGTPLLLLVFDSRDVIQMSIFLSLATTIPLLPKIIKELDCLLLKRLFIASVFGAPIGLLFFAYVSLDMLKITVGIVVTAIALFLLVNWLKIRDSNQGSDQELQQNNSPSSKTQAEITGFLAGTLTTSVGMPGIPLSIYFSVNNTKKEIVRGTTLAFFIGVYIVSIILQLLTVKISANTIITTLKLLPILIVGVLVGNLLHYRINQRTFQLIINLVLIYTGLHMILKSI